MAVSVSPLDLELDKDNPRFVILSSRDQATIRKYLVTYEDVCLLATAINSFGGLLPGERIVVLHENDKYVVVEGNRRTCSLQLLLSRDLIPDGFAHKIPATSDKIIESCTSIEVDVIPDREAALALMTRRHIEGVKQWKPLAKKQFFAAHYNAGQSISNLSRITGINENDIKEDIRDYKFFFSAHNKYCEAHPDFNREIVRLKTDPFWRVFHAKFEYPAGTKVKPKDLLRITYDEEYNTHSTLDADLFNRIVQLVFEQAIVTEAINTRNVLTDVVGIDALLQAATTNTEPEPTSNSSPDGTTSDDGTTRGSGNTGNGGNAGPTSGNGGTGTSGDGGMNGGAQPGGPQPGGPPPRSFFETISWNGKLDPANQQHQGLLFAINELFRLSNATCGRQKAYKVFPVATGMILRTVYEQALRLRMTQSGIWGSYCNTRNGALPTLSTMESFINQATNKPLVFPDQGMILMYDRVIAATHRDFLNANTHYPGNINVTPDSLEAISAAGMYALIQGIINLI